MPFDINSFRKSLLDSLASLPTAAFKSAPCVTLNTGYPFDMPSSIYPALKPAYLRSKDIVFYTSNSEQISSLLDDNAFYGSLKISLEHTFRKKIYDVKPSSIAQSFNLIPPGGHFPWHNDRNNLTILFVASGSDQKLIIRYPFFFIRSLFYFLEGIRSCYQFESIYRILFMFLKPLSFVFSSPHVIPLSTGTAVVFDGHLSFHSITNRCSQYGSHFVLAYDLTSSFDFNHQLSSYYGKN